MKLVWRALVVTAILALAPWSTLVSALAQQASVDAMFKRSREFRAIGEYTAALAEAEKLEAAAKAQFGTAHRNYLWAVNELAIAYDLLGKYADAEQLYKRALAIGERALGADHIGMGAVLHNLAIVYDRQARHVEAEQLFKRALAIREKSPDVNHLDVAATLNSLAIVYQHQRKYSDAQHFSERAVATLERLLGMNHPNVALSLNTLAAAYSAQRKYSEAESRYRRALAIQEQKLSANHPSVALTLDNLAVILRTQARYAEAEQFLQRALAAREQVLGSVHPDVATTLHNLSIVYQKQEKYTEAEQLLVRTLSIREKVLGVAHRATAEALIDLANVYALQGRYGEAEQRLYGRALVIIVDTRDGIYLEPLINLAQVHRKHGKYWEAERLYRHLFMTLEKVIDPNDGRIAPLIAQLASLSLSQGKYVEAEKLYKRALAIKESAIGPNHPEVADILNDIGAMYFLQARYVDAEGLLKRALSIAESATGHDQSLLASILNNLAGIYRHQSYYTEAEALLRRTIEVKEHAVGKNHPNVASSLIGLGNLYSSQGKYVDAEQLFQDALKIIELALGRDHPDVALPLNQLAGIYRKQNNFSTAELFLKRALIVRESVLRANHPDVAQILYNLASLDLQRGDIEGALVWSRKATNAVVSRVEAEAPGVQQQNRMGELVEQSASFFRNHLISLAATIRQGAGSESVLASEALEVAQWANHSSAAAAVHQMSLRFVPRGGELAMLVRENQDLATSWRARDDELIAALSKPERQQNRMQIEALRKQVAAIEGRLGALAARFEQDFPRYASLMKPNPLKVADVEKLLGAEEALVFFLTGDRESYVFGLMRDGFQWRTIPMGEKALADKVTSFRRGLDVDELSKSIEAGRPVLFDLGAAHELYATLLAPVEALIKDKRHLMIVPSGPLTALPFHLLVTDRPAVATPEVKDIAAYRDAAWLLKRQAVTVLPSVSSLKALRVFAKKEQGAKPLIGFGDPVFGPEQPAAPQRGAKVKVATTRAYSDFWRGAAVDREQLAQALPRLEDTADELKAVSARLGAPASDIHLRAAASESNVKRARLADYRVVYFATHGLVAGDVKGLGEPALALTIPKESSDLDDGLLTASEVAQLKLNADWVVLSACNTMAGDKPGAEALSGLARAFFYAGSRALLVSHWAVASDAATRLTTATFDELKANLKIGRAEALRRAMLAYMNDASNPRNAYPAFWGPFAIVGEGGAK